MASLWENLSNGGGQGGSSYGGGYPGGNNYQGASPSSGFNWQDFQNLRQQISDRNQYYNMQSPDYFAGYDGRPDTWNNYVNQYSQRNGSYNNGNESRSPFSLSGGTERLFNNKYRKANAADVAAIKAGEVGEWWMNLPSNIASFAGNDQLAEDLRFDANKFDLSNGFGMDDATQLRNFALSVPGMIPGGLFEGAEKAYEAVTGAPVQEHRKTKDGGYEIADYTLDWNQRAASGLDAAIDIGGTFLGGSGKVLSVGGKAVGRGIARSAEKKAVKAFGEATTAEAQQAAFKQGLEGAVRGKRFQDRADKIAQSVAGAGEGLLSKAGMKGGKITQFGANVAEEAGEEFAQSYLEDFRNKEYDPEGSFRKATQSAAWGALGGGIMHGLGAAGNAVFHGRYDAAHRDDTFDEASDTKQATAAAFSRAREYERFDEANKGFSGSTYTPAILKAAGEKLKDPERIPASTSAFGTMFADDLNLKQTRISLGMLDAMCQIDDEGKSIHGLAERFHTTDEDVLRIRSIADPEARRREWKNLLDNAIKQYGKVTILGGRNPDTNMIGIADFDVVDIVPGDGIQLNSLAWKMLGGDVDGDRYQSYFYATGPVRSTGYLTKNMWNDVVNKSNLDEDYITFLGQNRATYGFRQALSKAMNDLVPDGLFDKKTFEHFVSDFHKNNNSGIDDLTKFLVNLRTQVFLKTDKELPANQRWSIADEVIARAMHETHLYTTRTARHFDDVVTKLTDDQRAEIESATRVVEEDLGWLRSGNNQGKTHAADFIGLFGKRIALNTGADLGGNATMRQSGALKFEAYEEQDIWFDDSLSTEKVQSRFENLIAYAFALEAVGEDVQNTIEGVFWVSVVDSTLSRFTMSNGRVDLAGNWESFIDILIDEYNSKVGDFNEVLSRNSTVYGMDIVTGSKKREIDPTSKADVAQVFRRAFGDSNVQFLLPIDEKSPLWNCTINQVVNEYTINGVDVGPFSNIPGFNDLFKYLVQDYGSTARALDVRYENTIGEIGNKLVEYQFTDIDNLVRINRNESGDITGVDIIAQDRAALIYAVESAQYIFGEDECMFLGIGSVEGFLSTRWGQEWMSGDANRMINAVIAAKISYLYRDAVNFAVAKPDNWANDLEIELRNLAFGGGALENAILADWIEHKDLGLLKILQDLDTRLDEKNHIWDQITKNNEGVNSLLSELFMTGNDTIGTSMYTEKLKSAKRSMMRASQHSNVHNRSVLEGIRNLPSHISESQKIDAIQAFISDAYTTTSTNAVAAFIHSQRDVVKGMVDKGVAPSTSDIIYQMREHVLKGGMFSSLEEMDLICGSMSIGKLQTNRVEILKVLSDPSIEIRAYDPTSDKYIWISRDAIFKEVLGDNYPSPDTSFHAWEQLFDACPQLVSLVTPTHIGVQTTKGSPSVNEGTKVSLDKAIENYVGAKGDVLTEYQHAQFRNQAFHIAMGDPNWWSVLVADPRFTESETLADTKSHVEEAIRENLEWILSAASLDPQGSSYYEKTAILGRHAVGQMFAPVRSMTQDADLNRALSDRLGSIDATVSGSIFVSAMQNIVDSGISRMLGGLKLRLHNGKLKKLKSDDMSDIDDIAKQAVALADQAEKLADEVETSIDEMVGKFDENIHLTFVALNMIDPDMFNVSEYMETQGMFGELEQALERYKVDHADDQKAQKKIAEIEKALVEFKTGGIGGFTSFVFGTDVTELLRQEDFDDVITASQAATMSEQEFKDAVHTICDKYNFNESRSKIDKDIENAYKIENETERVRRLNNIRNYYNQITLEYLLKQITPSGNVYNFLAPKQTMDAYQIMFNMADKVRDEFGKMGIRLEPTTAHLKPLNIDYGNPVASCMSQHMAMNAASGSITTGIGLDGSMLNLVGGLGLVRTMEPIEVEAADLDDTYYGWSYTAQIRDDKGNITEESGVIRYDNIDRLRSLGTVNVSKEGFIGESLEVLVNFIQEAMHLKAKKSLGAIKAFSDPAQIDREMYSDISVDQVKRNIYPNRTGDISLREYLHGALKLRRYRVEGVLRNWYNSDDVSGLDFEDRHAKAFSNVMVNLVEVRVGKDEANGVDGGVYYISSSALASDEAFLEKGYDFGYGAGIMPPVENIVVRPVVMGLQEVSEKIIRNVAKNYYAAEDSGTHPSEDQVLDWANSGMYDFDGYNSDPISVRGFLDGIQPNPPMVDNPMLGDMNFSARTLWNDRRSESLQNILSPRRYDPHPMSDSAWEAVRNYNESISRTYPSAQSFFSSYQIVSYFDDGESPLGKGAFALSANKELLPKKKATGNEYSKYDRVTDRQYDLVEMYNGDTLETAEKALNAATSRNRALVVKEKVARHLIDTREDLSSIFSTTSSFQIGSESYVLIDTRGRQFLETYRKENMTIPTTDMDPSEISIAIGTLRKLGLPDAGHLTHPDYRSGKYYSDAVDITPENILDQGFGAVTLVTDLREVASISMDQIDFSYYEHNIRHKDISIYKDNAASFINDMVKLVERGINKYPKSLKNVPQDGCVGFIKQAHSDGTFTYAPLYYEGSVARTAETVTVNQGRSGKVRVVFSSENVDYNGIESQKLDLYGVAYKTVGHVASDKDLRSWAAIDDAGYGVVTRADHMFDENSVKSRLFELGDTLLHNSLVYFTRKVGTNAFFVKQNGNWVLRGDLHSDITPVILRSLISGDEDVWKKVASEKIHVYQDEGQNRRFSRAVSDIQGVGGFAHLLFNTARVELDANGNPVFRGLERRNFDPHAVFKYWNTDDFLALWNHQDSRLCPATISESDKGKVFDRQGRMLDKNTIAGEQPRRCITVVGPNFYSGEGTAIADASRGATFSNQHIIKRLLADGLYRHDIRSTVDALAVAVDMIDRAVPDQTIDEQIKHWRQYSKPENPTVDQKLLDRMSNALKDPLYLSVIERRKQALNDKAEDLYSPLLIVESLKSDRPASDTEEYRREMETAVQNLNDALGKPTKQNMLTMGEVVMLVRLMTGFTTNASGGIKTITKTQFVDAVNQMVKSLQQNRRIIVGGRYKTQGDIRVSIPLMPRGLATRLAATPVYKADFNGDVDAILKDQRESLDASIAAIKDISDPAKRNELFQLADAMCITNGYEQVSGHLIQGIYIHDIMESARKFGFALQDSDPSIIAEYDEAVRINDEWANKIYESNNRMKTSKVDVGGGKYEVVMHGDDRTIVTFILRQMAAGRRAIGLTYLEMPLSNMLDRAVGQTMQSWVYALGRIGIGPYRVTQKMNESLREEIVKSGELRKFWSAMREAQLLGVDRELLAHVYSGEDLDTAIANTLKEQGAIERFSNKVMNIASGKDFGIEKQLLNFIDRFWQRSQTEARWWHQKLPGQDMTLFEQRLMTDPVGLFVDLYSGRGEGKAADMLLARQCTQQALAGDMAQKNLVSAFVGEVAKRSAAADFAITTLATPYFQYATNRMGKILNTVAPISTLHYVATQFFTKGPGGTMRIAPWSETTFAELGLDEVQVKQSLKEAIYCDMCHMGGTVVAMMLAGLALTASGILEPPEDDDKKGNFEEWTFFGMRINANWWIEDSLGIALPLACFWASAMRGEPRIDLMINGISHYLSNNPVAKVADAARVLFDPMAELYREYDQDIEGYAKAMGGPPDVWSVLKGKWTSFGLSYASQFITPGILREFYQAGQGNEVAYKRVFETDATGKLTLDARENNRTQYTTYEDAVIRKFTKDNPVMGFLADIIIRPETGYMNHEMPDRIIYEPEQMNSIQAFSMYADPYTKNYEKTPEEQYATALMVIATLQSNSVEDLVKQGFMIDYDTKKVVGEVIWDMIATENAQWAELEQNGALSYYNAGYGSYDDNVRVISEMRECHKAYIQNLKDLYHNKLWSDELYSVAMYNQENTEWAQDVNGNWYATGFAPTVMSPFVLAPGESPGEYQKVMSRENDWQTESIVTGNPTGQRALIPITAGRIEMPDKPRIESNSSDGTSTGHSDLYDKISSDLKTTVPDSATKDASGKTKYPKSSGGNGYGGGGGGYRRGGGGRGSSGGSGYTPSTSAPSAHASITSASLPRTSLSKVNPSRIMGTDRLVEPGEVYLRPNFETKGSRDAYKRSDI